MFCDVSIASAGENEVDVCGKLGITYTPGDFIVIPYASREFPGIFVNESQAVRLESVRLYHTTGMGVIAQLSSDLTLDHVVAAPRAGSGRMVSVNADATHFVNCRGKITMTHCKFERMNDDACNIHGIYACCVRRTAPNTLICGFGHDQQRGINLFRPGDCAALIDSDKTEARAVRTVVAAELLSPDALQVVFDEPIPEPGAHDVIENRSTAPEVYIADCESGYNRPRGFLLSSAGKTHVERCKFYNMNSGIQIGGEMRDWYESGAVQDVRIQNCDFTNSAYAGGVAISVCPKLRDAHPRAFFHGRIVIEQNYFEQSSKRILNAMLTETLQFRDNRFRLNPNLPYHPANGATGITVAQCGTTEIAPVESVE